MAVLLDSYTPTTTTVSVVYGTSTIRQVAQTFTAKPSALTSCKFQLYKFGTPTGSVYAYLYAATGSFGSNSKPTGSPLATSAELDVATLTTNPTDTELTFATPYALVGGTVYAIAIGFAGGDASNHLRVRRFDTSPSAPGDASSFNGTVWTSMSSNDYRYYLYGNLVAPWFHYAQMGA